MKNTSANGTDAALLELINQTDDKLSFVDRDYVYRAVNQAYVQLFNKPLDEIIGRPIWEIMGTDAFEKVAKPYLERAMRGEEIAYEAWFDFFSAKRTYMIVRYRPYIDPDGNVGGVYVTATDITERKRLEEEKAFYEQLMITQSRMARLGEMMAFIAHQWRGPLNTLSTYLLRFRMEFGDRFAHSHQNLLERSEKVLENMSEDIEELYRFYNQNDHNNDIRLKTSAEQAVSLLEHRLNAEKIRVDITIPEEFTLSYHQSHLLHIFTVFLENALEAFSRIERSDKRIGIDAYGDDHSLFIDISDNASGIDPAITSRLFEPGTSTKTVPGHGHGLYFVRKLLFEHLNGTLELLPACEGARFRLSIPKTSHA
ncbi:MAG: PAS domain-containing protein [Campylobacterales bacterium]|nr:PAS domain-containing protein [Campylobacterales bacterium]